MGNTPFKMGGFSGFGNSPLRQEKKTKKYPVSKVKQTIDKFIDDPLSVLEINPITRGIVKRVRRKFRKSKNK